MNTIEILLLSQTLILLVTGVVIAWYTWEANQLRKIANMQLRVTRTSLENEMVREVRSVEPVFDWSAEESAPSRCVWHFVNTGEPVTDVIALARWKDVRIEIKPTHSLPRGARGTLEIQGLLPEALDFSIVFRTRTGRTGVIDFRRVAGEKPYQSASSAYL